jgi:hypothetical protein
MQIYHIHKLLWKAPTVFTEWTSFIGVTAAPTSGWDAGERLGVEIGAALSRVGLESGPDLTMAFVSSRRGQNFNI